LSASGGLVFSATYLWGSFALLPASGGISPTNKLRKNSALTPVTSEKTTLFSWVTKIVRLCKAQSYGLFIRNQGPREYRLSKKKSEIFSLG